MKDSTQKKWLVFPALVALWSFVGMLLVKLYLVLFFQ